MTQWNPSRFEFKFDDTRLSSKYKNKIGVALSLPCWLSQFIKAKLRQPTGQRLSNFRTQQTKITIGQILFLYFEESLVSSNLNSKQLRFHCVRSIVHTCLRLNSYYSWQESKNDRCRKRFHCVLDKWLMINEGNSTHLKRKCWIQGQKWMIALY